MKLGNDFKVPDELLGDGVIVDDLAGYKIIMSPGKGVLIQGLLTTNLFDMPVCRATIIPYPAEQLRDIEDYPFDINEDELVYCVAYSDRAWYFLNMSDALSLVGMLVSIKAMSLKGFKRE